MYRQTGSAGTGLLGEARSRDCLAIADVLWVIFSLSCGQSICCKSSRRKESREVVCGQRTKLYPHVLYTYFYTSTFSTISCLFFFFSLSQNGARAWDTRWWRAPVVWGRLGDFFHSCLFYISPGWALTGTMTRSQTSKECSVFPIPIEPGGSSIFSAM